MNDMNDLCYNFSRPHLCCHVILESAGLNRLALGLKTFKRFELKRDKHVYRKIQNI